MSGASNANPQTGGIRLEMLPTGDRRPIRKPRIIDNKNEESGYTVRQPQSSQYVSLLNGYAWYRLMQIIFNIDLFYIIDTDDAKQYLASKQKSLSRRANHSNSVPKISLPSTTNEAGVYPMVPLKKITQRSTNREIGGNNTIIEFAPDQAQQQHHAEVSPLALDRHPKSTNPEDSNILDRLYFIIPFREYYERSPQLRLGLRCIKTMWTVGLVIIFYYKIFAGIVSCFFLKDESFYSFELLVRLSFMLNAALSCKTLITKGHKFWNCLSQKLFLVSSKTQCKIVSALILMNFIDFIAVRMVLGHKALNWACVTKEYNPKYIWATHTYINFDSDFMNGLLLYIQIGKIITSCSSITTISYIMLCIKEHVYSTRHLLILSNSIKKHPILKRKKYKKSLQNPHTNNVKSIATARQTSELVPKDIANGTSLPADINNLGSEAFMGKFQDIEQNLNELYLFVSQLNEVSSEQNLLGFVIVQNMLTTMSLIGKQDTEMGLYSWVIRIMILTTGLAPYICGHLLNSQLNLLSEQLDRVIIQQQLNHNTGDRIIRLKELVNDIKIDCGGLFSFNIQSGIKFIVVAVSAGFFITQERKLLNACLKPDLSYDYQVIYI